MNSISAAVILTLALALGVQSSVIPLVTQIAGHGLSYTAHGPAAGAVLAAYPQAAVAVHAAPWAHGHWDDGHYDHAWDHGHWDHHGLSVVAHAAPVASVVAHAAPAAVVVAPVHEGTYVAQTRGAVHTANLSGHTQSVAAINAAPAPGTL